MTLSRRDTTKLILSGTAFLASSGPSAAFFHSEKEVDWPTRIQAELDRHVLNGCEGKLTLTQFDMQPVQGGLRMASIIRLDWPPGYRTRRFDASGDDASATASAMLNKALFSFARAWPGCIV